MSHILGLIFIVLVSLITFIVALRYPAFSKILFVALIIRISFLLLGEYVITLPDSTADAKTFELVAWALGQEGFFSVLSNYSGPSSRFISWLIAIPFSLFGRSMLMAKSISLFFGMGSVFLGCLVANKLWSHRITIKVGWTIALFPSLVLYSAIVMREAYIVFFILLALYGVIDWIKTDNFKSIFIALIGFTGATFFHGAMMIGAICFFGIIGLSSFKRFGILIKNFRINLKILSFILIFTIGSGLYILNKINVPYLGDFQNTTNIDHLLRRTQNATTGDASWPEWTKINSPIEMIYKAPIRSLYVVFAPFPWDVKKTKHLIGMFDAFLYFYLTFLILLNIKAIWKDPALRIILLMLLSYIFVFGIGVGNFGTGIRHRSKFVIMFILLAAPYLKKFTIFKHNKKT